MRVYFNRKPVTGPWGGGSKILHATIECFKQAGHDVLFKLNDAVDVIFCFDPRQGSEVDLVDYDKIYQYVHGSCRNKSQPLHLHDMTNHPFIVQRVGDIGSHGKPDLLDLVMASSVYSDVIIFPSLWAFNSIQNVFVKQNDIITRQRRYVIQNAPMAIFHKNKLIKKNLPEKLSFVTHHWSTNHNKGFEFYAMFKKWCEVEGHQFTFIGREPTDIKIDSVGPMSESELAIELPKHDVYVTASLNEAGANHVLEAMAVGLPVIYHKDGGSIVEYCATSGVSFDGSIAGFKQALSKLRFEYMHIKKMLQKYEQTADDVAQSYLGVIEEFKRG
jgi:glycosyltransferase involved in cell wall biosynthesis